MRGSSLAKISRPSVKQAFPRKRLFALLDRMRNEPVTWVSGLAGCGKTTLVSSYIDDRCLPCLWYQIDQGDQDVATFFYYMRLAVKKASRKRKSLPLLTPEYLQDIPTFTRRFFENAFSQLKPSTIIVLDNYQLIREESKFHEVLLQGLSTIPEGFHVLLISRNAPPPPLVRLQANRLMGTLGWNELRLTLKESVGIGRLMSPKIPSRRTLEYFHMLADGWAGGLILILESVKRGVDPQLLKKTPPEEIMDYFGNELFSKIDGEEREFLLKTAFMPKITPRMAESLTGISQASSILSRLSRENSFTHKRHYAEPVYEYHPLLREFLISRAREIFSREAVSDLVRRSAMLLEEADETDVSAELYSDINDWENLTGLILKHAANLLAQGRSGILEDWLNRLPREMMEKVPWLLYWKGLCRMPYSPSEARSIFEEAFHLFEAAGDDSGTCLAWSGIVDCIDYEWDDSTRFDRWIDWLDKRMQHNTSFPSPEIEARVRTSMAGALVMRRPYRPDIEGWLTLTLRATEETGDINLRVQSYSYATVYYCMWLGEVGKLSMLVGETKRMPFSSSATPLNHILWKTVELLSESLVEDPQIQVNKTLEAIEIGNQTGVHVLDHMLFAQGTYGALSLGDLPKAEEFLHAMETSFVSSQRNIAAHYHFLSGWCQLLRGRVYEAHAHAERSLGLAVETGAPVPEILARAFMCQILHRKGDDQEAFAQMATLKALIERYGYPSYQYQLLLIEAQFAMDHGDEEHCIKALHEGLTYAKSIGLKTIMGMWQPSVMARLFAKALEKGIEVEYVRNLIRMFRLPSENISPEVESWPWRLKIHTLGNFAIEIDATPLKFSGKVQKKPLLLLKALVALGGRNVKEEDVADLLWPNADGDAAHISLTTTLSRLRRLVGHEEAIQLKEGRLELDGRYCWVDTWAFEHLVSQADASWQKGEAANALVLAEKAINIYKAHFLAGESEEPWIASIRERLRNKFLRNLSKLGHHYQQAGQWEKSLGFYYRGLEVDDLEEEIYQCIMLCCSRLGRKAEGIRAYELCRNTLSTILGVEPSPETEAFYKQLRSGNR